MTADPVTADVAAPHRAITVADSARGGLPRGWAWTTLGGVIVPNRDVYKPADAPHLPFVGMEHVEAETMRLLGLVSAGEMKSNALHFWPGDVIYGRLRPYLNKVLCPEFEGLCSAEFIVFRETPHLDNGYLQYFLNSWAFRDFASHLNEGDRPRVDWDQLKVYPFPLPPLAEQHRIVAAIEQQFTRLDAGVAALRRAQAALKRYRAAVLKAAVEGRLTDDWRRAHPLADPQSAQADFAAARPPGANSFAGSLAGHGALEPLAGPAADLAHPPIEPASTLLARILAERRARWETELRAKDKDPARTRYPEPAGPDTASLPTLPEGWCWATVDQLADVGTGATPLRSRKDYYKGGTIPWVTSGALNADRVTAAEELITEKALAETNAKLFPPGTLLLAMYGEGKTRGKVAELLISAATNQACAALMFRPSSQPTQPYVKLFLLGNYSDIRALSSGGVQPNLNLSTVRNTALPLPSLAEQQAIVAEVERRLSVVAELEAAVAANLARAERLRQVILREAFAGRLVPQDPDDEPASALLERIRREWAEVSIPSGRRSARASNPGLRPPTLTERPAGDKTSMAGTARPVQQEVPWKE